MSSINQTKQIQVARSSIGPIIPGRVIPGVETPSTTPSSQSQFQLTIQVRDGGPGVPEGERERIFLHFVTQRAGGTGLGLAIARQVAERHGGDLSVSDAPEGGANFTLTLPREGTGGTA